MLPPGMASMYSPSTSFQSLLANMTAIPRPPPGATLAGNKAPLLIGSPELHSPNNLIASPPTSPSSVTSQSAQVATTVSTAQQHSPVITLSLTHQSMPPAVAAPPPPNVPQSAVVMAHHSSSPQHQSSGGTSNSQQANAIRSVTPPEDRRSSSIAALRLKAREHELKLEMLRQNGHQSDVLS